MITSAPKAVITSENSSQVLASAIKNTGQPTSTSNASITKPKSPVPVGTGSTDLMMENGFARTCGAMVGPVVSENPLRILPPEAGAKVKVTKLRLLPSPDVGNESDPTRHQTRGALRNPTAPRTTRTEADLLGPRQIPSSAYYGVHTLRAMENFQISPQKVSDIPQFVRGMILVKKAAAQANGELGTIEPKIADAIVKACDHMLETGKGMDQFPTDTFQGGAGTSTNMNANEVIANIALEMMGREKGDYDVINPNDHVNKCQSTNDAYPTGLRVGLQEASNELLEELASLRDFLSAKGEEFSDVLKMGRTQLQDAVPMSLGREFRAFASILNSSMETIRRSQEQLLEINLGGTAIGTGLNAHEAFSAKATQRLAEATGLPFVLSSDLVAATSDCDSFVALSSALKQTAVRLNKICNDLRLISSGPRTGLSEINLPEMQAGSSIMPAKINPVIPEVVNQVCFKVFGNDLTVTMAANAGQLQLNVMEPVIAQSLFESLNLMTNACQTLKEKCVESITANAKRCEDEVLGSIGIVTYLNPLIGHHEGDRVGKICAATGKTVREVVLELGLLDEERLDQVLSMANLKEPQYSGAVH